MIVWKGVKTMRPGGTSGRFWTMRPIIRAVDCVAARKTWQQLAAIRLGRREPCRWSDFGHTARV
jgi:hypothetical protein